MRNLTLIAGIISIIIFVGSAAAAKGSLPLDRIVLPQGFSIEIYADNVPNAREMCLGDRGTVFVGTRAGSVYALVPDASGTRAAKTVTIARNLDEPNGVAFRKGALYVAEIERVVRYDDIENRLTELPPPAIIRDDFPKERQHGWKYIRFGPDDSLYVPVGMPCNICERSDDRFGTIMRMRPDGSGLEVFARGIRNTVGFDWDHRTGQLWFTDNGRDYMGDNAPPDELNRAPVKGMDFGFPYFHGHGIPDPEFGKGRHREDFVEPEMDLAPHVAALGMRFYDGPMFPEQYRGQIFIAEHGSWNRTIPIGYRVSLVRLDGQRRAVRYEVFAEGWLQGGSAWGRPVDVLTMPDGALLVSDDKAGVIYRIQYDQKR